MQTLEKMAMNDAWPLEGDSRRPTLRPFYLLNFQGRETNIVDVR